MKKCSFLTIITLLVFISSCKKDTNIGADILPPDDLLNVKFTDTLTLYSKTLADTFLRTDKLAKNYLGVINDIKFGTQKASIVMELDKPTSVYDDTLNTSYTIDSVVLFLKYSSIYGDTTEPQSFEVSTIGNKINENSAYYYNTTQFPSTGLIGSVSNYLFTPTTNKVHTTISDTVGVAGILRIKLDNSVGNTIINLGQSVLRDSAAFKNAFPGIRIENSNNLGRAMAEIDLNSLYSSIAIFYKDKYGTKKDMRLFTSIVKYTNGVAGTRVNGINLFSNTLSSALQNTIASGELSDSISYVLGQGGATIKISMPTISNLGNIAVNKAVVAMAQIIPNASNLNTPYYLVLLKHNNDGHLDVLPTGDGVGILDTTTTDGFGNKIARYNFNITKYVQAVANGTISNTDLYSGTYRFAGTDGTVNVLNSIVNGTVLSIGYSPARVIVAGANHSDARYKMKINLTYTKIN